MGSAPTMGWALHHRKITGDRDALPHLQRLAVYSREALLELEARAYQGS